MPFVRRSRSPRAIPAFLSVDVEPDGFQLDRGHPPAWDGYGAALELVERLRAALASRTGAAPRFGWYYRTDPQIAEFYGRPDHVLTTFPDRVASLGAAGDYFGVHAHPVRWSEDRQLWVHDFADADWHARSVGAALDGFAAWAGTPAQRYRAGAGFLTNGMVNVLEQRGVGVELSLEPVAGWGLHASDVPSGVDASPIVGPYTDCHTAPRVAYRPARHDFRVDGGPRGRRLVMIPLATRLLSSERPRWKQVAVRLLRRPETPREMLYPAAPWPSAHGFWDLVTRQLRTMRRPYLSLGVRTDAADSVAAARVRKIFEALPEHALAERLRFVDPLAVAADLV